MFTCCNSSYKEHSFLKESNGKGIRYESMHFQNWGGTVTNSPAFTFYPRSKTGIQNLITWARTVGKKVRVAAYRHTWSPLYADDQDILLSLISKNEVISFPAIHQPLDGSNSFQRIELVGEPFMEDGKKKQLCKIGTATTNEQFRAWVIDSFKKKGSDGSWTVPQNVIMVENTFGGTTSLACHGGGIHNKTMSDLVTEIEFINPLGQIQTIGYKITDPKHLQKEGKALLKAASASFGMLGVVTSFTYKLDQLTHAKMKPVKKRLALTIPPPEGLVLPNSIPDSVMAGVTEKDLQRAREDFIMRAENHYYTEWFWFSLHEKGWINTWMNDGDESKSVDYPDALHTKIQELEEYLLQLSNKSIMKLLPPKIQAKLLSDAAMLSLPDETEITTPLIDALHFRRGIQNMKVQDMEFEIPIPRLANGKFDWNICQRAWWDVIITVYEWQAKKGKTPMRLPLEMRIMGGSDAIMAPQHHNEATCSIEVLTLMEDLVDADEWLAFLQDILDKWAAYTDFEGKPLNIRPHWAKQWQGLTIQRKNEPRLDMIDYLKTVVYKNELPLFLKGMEKIAEKGGYELKDGKLFSNALLNKLFNEEKMSLSKPDITPPSKKSNIIKPDFNPPNLEQINKLLKQAEKAYQTLNQPLTLLEEVRADIDAESMKFGSSPSQMGLFKTPIVQEKNATKEIEYDEGVYVLLNALFL